MFEFLLGYFLGRSKNSEPEYPRYFRESPPREETKEEKRARVVFLIVLCMLAISTLIISQNHDSKHNAANHSLYNISLSSYASHTCTRNARAIF